MGQILGFSVVETFEITRIMGLCCGTVNQAIVWQTGIPFGSGAWFKSCLRWENSSRWPKFLGDQETVSGSWLWFDSCCCHYLGNEAVDGRQLFFTRSLSHCHFAFEINRPFKRTRIIILVVSLDLVMIDVETISPCPSPLHDFRLLGH